MTFQEAATAAAAKGTLPTTLRSADIAGLSRSVRRHAVFSATLDKLEVLEALKKDLELAASGKTDESGRLRSIPEMKARLKANMIAAGIVPAPPGTPPLQDLLSDTRRQLIVETQVLSTANYGRYIAANDSDALGLNPARELVRMTNPKGEARDWESRWIDAGGELVDGRMVDLADSSVWQNLGDGVGGYSDTLGNPYAPFAFNSGMNTIDIGRREAEELGLLTPDEPAPEPQTPPDLLETLQADTSRFDASLLLTLRNHPELEVKGGVLRPRAI